MKTTAGWRLFLTLTTLIVIGIVATGLVQARVDDAQQNITCTSARANISQLTALREISDQLGVPVTFTIPEVPAECDGH